MTKSGSKYMKIKIETETGNIVKIVDEKGNNATKVDPAQMEQISQSQGFKHVGTILHAHSSPGCVYFMLGGRAFKICY